MALKDILIEQINTVEPEGLPARPLRRLNHGPQLEDSPILHADVLKPGLRSSDPGDREALRAATPALQRLAFLNHLAATSDMQTPRVQSIRSRTIAELERTEIDYPIVSEKFVVRRSRKSS